MKATSAAQLEAGRRGVVPPLEQIRPTIWALPLSMPSSDLRYVISYLVMDTDRAIHVIDAGWDSDENWVTVLHALKAIGAGISDVRSVTLTHLHRDHVGMTHRYLGATSARVAMSRVDHTTARSELAAKESPTAWLARAEERSTLMAEWGVPEAVAADLGSAAIAEVEITAIEADVLLDDGDELAIPGIDVRVVTTPGHTGGSICLALEDDKLLFTGDHLLPAQFPGVGLGGPVEGNPISDYLLSLEKLAPFDRFEALPGHGYRFEGIAERRVGTQQHHFKRTRDAVEILASDPQATVWQIASRLRWSAGWKNLTGRHLWSALSQTAWHRERALGER